MNDLVGVGQVPKHHLGCCHSKSLSHMSKCIVEHLLMPPGQLGEVVASTGRHSNL